MAQETELKLKPNLNFQLSCYCSEGLEKDEHRLHSNIERRLNQER